MGDDDPDLTADINKHKNALEAKYESLLQELQALWKEWDQLVDRQLGNEGLASNQAQRTEVRDKMVDVLNRRNYIRNLVRDVNAALEERND
jgi:molecular chaperone HscB